MSPDPARVAEYQALLQQAAVADFGERTLLELRGADRQSFLHSFCTQDIKALRPGAGCEAFITSHQGKTLGHVFVFCLPEALWLETVAGQGARLAEHLNRFVISEDVELRDRSAERGTLLVAGPEAAEKLAPLLGQAPPSARYAHAAGTIAGRDVWLARAPIIAAPAWLLQAAPADLPAVTAELQAAGILPASRAAVEMARVEEGFPWYGPDITDDNLPQEIGRDQAAIHLRKGCYLGQETVARIDAVGHVNRQLAGVRWEGETAPAAGTELLVGDKVVGQALSNAWSPRAGAPLSLALVRRVHAAPGTILQSAGGRGTVVHLPLA